MQDQFYTFNMFDAQAWYVRDIILGRIKLPKADAMKKDWKKWLKREKKLADAEQMIWFQGDYVKELIDATDYPSFDIEGVNKTFMVWEHHKMDDIMGFRNNSYTLADDRHHEPQAPHAVEGCAGRLAGGLSGDQVSSLTSHTSSPGLSRRFFFIALVPTRRHPGEAGTRFGHHLGKLDPGLRRDDGKCDPLRPPHCPAEAPGHEGARSSRQ